MYNLVDSRRHPLLGDIRHHAYGILTEIIKEAKEMKTITINLYSPKELWHKFWNRVFWPRRKACAEWIEIGEIWMEHAIITETLCKADYLDVETASRLELEIKPKMHEVFQKLEIAIKTPCDPIHNE